MITRFLLILAGLFAVGAVGAFLFYVSVLTMVTIVAIVIGLVATLALGYLAGSSLPVEPKAKPVRNVTAIDARRDVILFPQIAGENATQKSPMYRVITAEGVSSQSGPHRIL